MKSVTTSFKSVLWMAVFILISVLKYSDTDAQTIATSPLAATFCSCNSVNVSYTSSGAVFNPGNIFLVQLSNAAGNFAGATNIGNVASVAPNGTIPCVIPCNTPYGTGYRIRVISNSPFIIGSDNGANITINPSPQVTIVQTTGNCVDTLTAVVQGAAVGVVPGLKYYITNSPPWGSPSNVNEMNQVFGVGNWIQGSFGAPAPATIFAPGTQFVFIDGSDFNATALNNYMIANGALIESWVNAGGRLFLNSAPNQGGVQNWGFGGVQLNYQNLIPPVPNAVPGVNVNNPAHPINVGPYTPLSPGGIYTANYYAHANVVNGGTSLMYSSANSFFSVLTEMNWGAGLVLFGGMTTTNWHNNVGGLVNQHAINLRKNILFYTAGTVLAPTYTYLWNTGATTQKILPAASGIYTVTVTSNNGCTGTATYNYTQLAPPPVVNITASGALCQGGTVLLNAGPGFNSYLWDNGLVSQTRTIAAPGTYYVTVTNALGCTASDTIVITMSPIINLAAAASPPIACNGGTTTIFAIANGGVPPFQFSFNGGPFQVSNQYPNAVAGIYTVTVMDGNNCTKSTVLTINQPPPININVNFPPLPCNGLTTLTVNANGGQPAYQYSINGGPYQLSNQFLNVGAGVYTITVNDANNCTNTSVVNIGAVNALTLAVTNISNVTCNPLCNGTAQATAGGGAPAYTYAITAPGIINPASGAISGLCAGTYTVTVTDASLCTNTTSFTVTQPPVFNVTVSNITNVLCNPNCNGTAQANAVGGTPAYNYAISAPGVINAGTGAISALCAGTYTVTVTDANLCTATTSFTVTQPPLLTVNVSNIVNVTCNPNCNGTAQANAAGGVNPLTYSISAPGVINPGTGAISALCAGTYTVTVTDANLCTATTSFTVTQPPLLTLNVTNISNVTCNGLCNGSAQANGGGGLAPLNYSITAPGVIDPLTGAITALCAGTYTVTVTDANLCTATSSFTITQPPAVVVNITNSTPASCTPGCDGTVTVSAAAGITFTILPNVGVVQNPAGTFSGLCAGTNYIITGTDANACTGTTNITLSTPNAPVVTISNIANVTCNGLCNGSAQASATGGTPAYTFSITAPGVINPATGAISALCAGSYTVTVSDVNTCIGTTSFIITEPPLLTVSINAVTAVSCVPGCDGTATTTTAGGVAVYSYAISGGAAINAAGTASNLCAGITYTITVTDANLCTAQTTVLLVAPATPTITVANITDVTCNGLCNGTGQAIGSGGTNPLTYSITAPGVIDPVTGAISALCAGTYTVTVTDANFCTATTTFTINQPPLLTLALTNIVNVSCNGLCDGSAQATGSGGLNPLVYSITAPGIINAATGVISALCAGTYTVTVTDANLCTATTTFTITQSPVLTLGITNITNVTCNGLCNGTAQATAAGGNNPLTYSITAPGVINAATGAISGLCAGSYTVTVTDANLCSATSTFTVTEPPLLTLSISNVVDVLCNGACTGTAQAVGLGGVNPLVYSMTAPGVINAATGAMTALCAGTYTVTVIDANLCSASAVFTVSEPPALIVAVSNITNVTCNGMCDGTAQATGSGGVGVITYAINIPGVIDVNTGAISALCAGTYTVTATDANLCTATTTFTVTAPQLLTLNVTNIVSPACYGLCTGTAQAVGAGGTNPLVYSITAPGVIDPITGAISALCAGSYLVTVTDANLCTATTVITVTQPLLLTVGISNIIDASCNGSCNGTAQATAVDGTPAYTYAINAPGIINAATGAISAMCAGTYTVTVTDANLCTATTSFTITEPNILTLSVTNLTNETCNGTCDGTGQATGSGGTNPLTYSISAPGVIDVNTGAITALCAGNYTVTVTDANLCTATSVFSITAPPLLTVSVSNISNVSCFASCDGTAQATATGGNNPISYAINAPGVIDVNTGAVSALCAGVYTVTVTDANLCSATTTFTVTEPTQLNLLISASTAPSCSPGCDGTVTVSGTGGTGLITYSIAPAAGIVQNPAGTFSGLCAGTNYQITATDANGCTATTNISLSTPNAPTVAVNNLTNVTCNGVCDGSGQASANGGTAPYTFAISAPGVIDINTGAMSNLCAGNYTVTVTDANSCIGTVSFTITEPNLLTIAVTTTTTPSCLPGCDGTATTTTAGGTPAFNYAISGGASINAVGDASNLCAGTTYTITVTDANNCSAQTTILLTAPVAPTIAVTNLTDVTCFGLCDGTGQATGTGGANPLTYTLTAPGVIDVNTGAMTSLCAGSYTVTVTDANQCTATASFTISEPPLLNLSANNITNVTCNGMCDGTAQATATGGTLPYIYSINAPGVIDVNTGAITSLCPGTYTITVGDGNLCSASTTFTVTQPNVLAINIANSTTPTCAPGCDGTATTATVGGTPGYTYTISGGANIDIAGNASALCAGITYTITVTDANACTGQTTILLVAPNSPVISITNSTNPSCVPGCDGTATTSVVGGTPVYAYTITGGAAIDNLGNITNLCGGTIYTITVTDANACSSTTTIQLILPNAPTITVSSSTNPTCVPGCDGTAVTATIGGVPGYTYAISGGASIDLTGNAINLCAGTVYTITVTDANACTATTTLQLIAPNSPGITISSLTNPSCMPGCDGTAITATVGGVPGYTYAITGGAAIDVLGNASNLCGGIVYTITVTDANSCTGTTTIQFAAVVAPVISINTTTDPTCVPGCNGTATTTIIGGAPAFIYAISGGAAIDLSGNATNLCGGITYTITVTDANGCSATTTVQLIAPTAPVVTMNNITAPSCNPGCDGTATTGVTGGLPAFTYAITGGAAIDNAGNVTNLCGGIIYTITVTDANQCTGTSTLQFALLVAPVVSIAASTDPSCVPGCDGTVTVSAVGGVAPIVYTIIPAAGIVQNPAGTFSGLCAGTNYVITGTDANGCTGTTNISLSTPNAPVVSVSNITNILCNGLCNGTAQASVVGGVAPYTYAISLPGVIDINTGAISSLCAGSYTVTVTDANSCVGTVSFAITEPPVLTFALNATTPPTCVPGCDGTATTTTGGGVPAYTYTISGGANVDLSGNASNLCSGITYTITATDANGCTAQTTVLLTAPNSPAINIVSSTNPSCNPGCDGTAVTATVGGQPAYSYSISNGGSIDVLGNASNLCGGIVYTITVTDANGCTGTTTIQFNLLNAPTINIGVTTAPTCTPGCDGTATTVVAGGAPAFTYAISGGAAIDLAGNATTLCAGITYTITVTDANGCSATTLVNLTTPNAPVVNISNITDVTCNGQCDGIAQAGAVGGAGGYVYTLNPLPGNINAGTGAMNNLCAGTYTVTVTDVNSCVGTSSFTINEPAVLAIAINNTTLPSCIPGCDGTATTNTTGGTPAYTYAISGGATIDALGNAGSLCGGTIYTITVTDANGCTGQTTIQLNAPNAPSIVISNQTDVSCFGVCDGTVTVIANGGVLPYNYTISPVATQAPAGTFTGLCAGAYVVTVTDALGCTATVNVNISQPALLTVNVPPGAITNVLIPGQNTGAAVATATGGTTPYTYTITPLGPQGPTGNFVNLTAQCYTVTVTDANGCTATTTFCVTEPIVPPVFTLTAVATDESCFGVCDGTITATPTGGAAPITYILNPGAIPSATGIYNNLCPGTYTVIGTDANNLTASATATVNGPTQIVFNAPAVVAPGCNPANNGSINISATGGTPGYTYSINPLGPQGPGGNFVNLTAQQYTITVTDASGCTATTTVNIVSPNVPSVTVSNIVDVLCNGQCNGTAQALGAGGVNPLTYSINAGVIDVNTGAASALCAGVYTVTVSDANLCTGTTSFTVAEPAALAIVQASSTNVNCNGQATGTITYVVNGGFGAIVYTNAPINNFNNLPANTYTATATDANGCTITSTFVISEPAALVINSAVANASACSGQPNGSIDLTISGGIVQYTVTINPNPPTANTPLTGVSPLTITGLTPNTYTVTVTDANGCSITSVVNVNGPAPIVFSNATATNASCNGSCNGVINIATTGGTGVVNYTINPVAVQGPAGTFTGLCAGTYTVLATDANGCTNTTSLTLTDPTAVVFAAVAHTDPLCGGGNDGSITVALGGGNPGYTYTLQPNNGVQAPAGNFINLTAAQYTVTGTDASGCSVTTIVDVLSPVALTWTNAAAVNVSCFGAGNGSMSVNATGGVGNLMYSIVPMAQANALGVFTPLPAQCYTVTATDVNGCILTATLCISEPPVLSLSGAVVQNNTCNGGASGTIAINAIGGNPIPVYTYVLTPGGQTNTNGQFTGLGAGTYTVTVTDGSGCTASTGGIVIGQPAAIVFSTVNLHEVYCYGQATGSIAVVAGGGTGNILFSISPNATQFPLGFFKDLNAGTYIITATDANGCTSTTAATIVENPELRITSLTIVEPICAYDSTGVISVTATGGVAPILYSLNNGIPQLTGTFTGLVMDNYKVTLIDNLGCSTDTTITVTGPTLVGASLQTEDTKCIDSKDGRVTIVGTGGRGGYRYYVTPGLHINKTGRFYDLAAGTYTIRVVDTVGCEYMTTFTINPPANPLGNTMTKQDLNCNGKGNEGSATANVYGGQPPYVYEWSTTPVQNTALASTLYFGWYNVLISDANGCEYRDSVYIEEGPCCDVSFVPNAFSPNGDNNNDEFRVFSTAGIILIQLEVYDRWGQKLWSTADWRRGWDGLIDGKEAGVGTYFYVFRYTCTRDGNSYIKKGDVTLIR